MTASQQHAARVMARADELALISETPEGLTRTYLSPQHLQANQRVASWMTEAGMRVWQDSVGNICGRYESEEAGAQAILLGSHLDTVRHAGRYDGILGVLTAIEVVHQLHQQGKRLARAIEVIGFCDEEGTRFGITLLGSRGLTGGWSQSWLAQTDAEGVSVAQAMIKAGLDPEQISQAIRPISDIAAYLELHIEQGPCLEQEALALGVVEAINGARRLHCSYTGEAGHAGTVPMTHRRDALAAAAEWMTLIESTTRQQDGNLVATVGTLRCLPAAVNVIPGKVTLTLDIRGPHDQPLAHLLESLLDGAREIAARRNVQFDYDEFYRIAATACDPTLQQVLTQAVEEVQGRSFLLPSGAGHDAMAIAERWPVAMLFVRCKAGISHHPAESVTQADVALAIAAFSRAVTALAEG